AAASAPCSRGKSPHWPRLLAWTRGASTAWPRNTRAGRYEPPRQQPQNRAQRGTDRSMSAAHDYSTFWLLFGKYGPTMTIEQLREAFFPNAAMKTMANKH